MTCLHRKENSCDVVCSLAGLVSVRVVSDAACAACERNAAPRQRNKVTLDLAHAALKAAGRADAAAALMAEATDIYQSVPDQAARLEKIRAGIGTGSQLWRLLESLGIKHKAACKCVPLAERMNALGPTGCRRERNDLVAGLRKNGEGYGWGDVAAAGARALLTGVAWRLDLLDVYGSLLDEAIRRAESSGAVGSPVAQVLPAAPIATPSPPKKTPQRLILATKLCPGDVLTLTAAVESLHQTYPGEYLIDVRTSHPEIWRHNPRITKSNGSGRLIEMHYPSIQRCNQEVIPFLAGYTEHLAEQIGRPLRLRVNRPYLYQSPEEQERPLSALWKGAPDLETLARGRPIWLVDAGLKNDYTIKGWPVEYYQEVIDRTCDRICWIQIGLKKHPHPKLSNVVSLLDTGPPMRETIVLASRASGGLGPVTFFQHLLAAWQKPYICLVGGREPATWVQYPYQHTLHMVGRMDCCREKSCWKARVVKLPDNDAKNKSLCEHPVTEGLQRPAAACMVAIEPIEVLALLERLA